MQILLLGIRYIPDGKPASERIGEKLAGQFVRMGHTVRMIVPGDFSFDALKAPLAQRLSRIAVEQDSQRFEYTRFDAKTAAGVDMYVLKCLQDSKDAYGRAAMGKATAQLVESMDYSPDITMVFDQQVTIAGKLQNCPVKVAVITSMTKSAPRLITPEQLAEVDRVAVYSPVLANKIVQCCEDSPLARLIARGEAHIMPLCSENAPRALEYKASAKASLQNSLGLPLQNDIPLFYINAPLSAVIDVLPSMLTQQLQAVCKCDADAIGDLLETYPDRLCALPPEVKDDIIVNGSDFCVQSHHPEGVAASLQMGTVPIVSADKNTSVKELSPDAQSGTGLLYRNGNLEESVAKAIGIFFNRAAFSDLRTRLVQTVTPIESVAAQLLEAEAVSKAV